MPEEISYVAACCTRFFDDPANGSPKPTMPEMKALDKAERDELGALALKALQDKGNDMVLKAK